MPSLSSFLPWLKPGVPFSTMNDAWPRWPSSGATFATTTVTSAMPPLEMKILVPLRTHSSPSRLAVVRSERDVGARARLGHRVGAELDLVAEAVALRTQRPICSGVPDAAMPAAASDDALIASAMPAQPQCSSSA